MAASIVHARLVKAKDRETQDKTAERLQIFEADEAREQIDEQTDEQTCINCGGELIVQNGARLCPKCNSADLAYQFVLQSDEDDEHVLIECPGATIYEEGTDNIIEGVQFLDDDDPLKGYRIVGKPVYPPTHTRWRRIKKGALGKIRRCQACQDYTVRMKRKEGCDFFIPSPRHPGRTKLKSVTHSSKPGHAY
jgi:hypothetical protein